MEGTNEVGMPAIHNFTERRLLKQIFEMRDDAALVTYTYMDNMQPHVVPGITSCGGKLTFIGQTIGYGIPYSTEFTNPMKEVCAGANDSTKPGFAWLTIPQADPNGLFPPADSEGTWILMKDPSGTDVKPVYIEPRIFVSPFKLPVD
jgi:hypothetical protein